MDTLICIIIKFSASFFLYNFCFIFKASTTNQTKPDTQKSVKRNSRNSIPEKHRKTVKNKRREQDPCISTLIINRVDRYGGVFLFALNWLFRLVLDVLNLSTHLAIHM